MSLKIEGVSATMRNIAKLLTHGEKRKALRKAAKPIIEEVRIITRASKNKNANYKKKYSGHYGSEIKGHFGSRKNSSTILIGIGKRGGNAQRKIVAYANIQGTKDRRTKKGNRGKLIGNNAIARALKSRKNIAIAILENEIRKALR